MLSDLICRTFSSACRHPDKLKTSSLKSVAFKIFKTCFLFAIASEENLLIACRGKLCSQAAQNEHF